MERFKRIFSRLLFPGLAVVLISVPVAAALLMYTFVFAGEDSPIAYPAYVFSAYALVITCAWIIKNAKRSKFDLNFAIHNIPLAHRYLTDISFKLHVSLYLSLGLNVLYAAMKFVYGVWYHSVWFGTLAVYYFLLAVMRFGLLRHANRNGFGKNITAELNAYRMRGLILMLMNVVKYRKYNSPVMSAAKVINLAAALVSMLSLETAMLAQFNNGENPETFRQMMTGSTGGCVCVIVSGIAIYMILRSTKQLRNLKKREPPGAG